MLASTKVFWIHRFFHHLFLFLVFRYLLKGNLLTSDNKATLEEVKKNKKGKKEREREKMIQMMTNCSHTHSDEIGTVRRWQPLRYGSGLVLSTTIGKRMIDLRWHRSESQAENKMDKVVLDSLYTRCLLLSTVYMYVKILLNWGSIAALADYVVVLCQKA